MPLGGGADFVLVGFKCPAKESSQRVSLMFFLQLCPAVEELGLVAVGAAYLSGLLLRAVFLVAVFDVGVD